MIVKSCGLETMKHEKPLISPIFRYRHQTASENKMIFSTSKTTILYSTLKNLVGIGYRKPFEEGCPAVKEKDLKEKEQSRSMISISMENMTAPPTKYIVRSVPI